MCEVGKQLKTIDAKVVNGFLIGSKYRTSGIRIKEVQEIEKLNTGNFCFRGFNVTKVYDSKGSSSLEDVILELGVDL